MLCHWELFLQQVAYKLFGLFVFGIIYAVLKKDREVLVRNWGFFESAKDNLYLFVSHVLFVKESNYDPLQPRLRSVNSHFQSSFYFTSIKQDWVLFAPLYPRELWAAETLGKNQLFCQTLFCFWKFWSFHNTRNLSNPKAELIRWVLSKPRD